METLKIGILYLGLYSQLVRKFGVNHIISRKEFFCKLGKHYLIPNSVRPLVLKEMEKKQLIKRIDRDNVQILACDIDLEKNASELFKLAGIF